VLGLDVVPVDVPLWGVGRKEEAWLVPPSKEDVLYGRGDNEVAAGGTGLPCSDHEGSLSQLEVLGSEGKDFSWSHPSLQHDGCNIPPGLAAPWEIEADLLLRQHSLSNVLPLGESDLRSVG